MLVKKYNFFNLYKLIVKILKLILDIFNSYIPKKQIYKSVF